MLLVTHGTRVVENRGSRSDWPWSTFTGSTVIADQDIVAGTALNGAEIVTISSRANNIGLVGSSCSAVIDILPDDQLVLDDFQRRLGGISVAISYLVGDLRLTTPGIVGSKHHLTIRTTSKLPPPTWLEKAMEGVTASSGPSACPSGKDIKRHLLLCTDGVHLLDPYKNRSRM